MAEMIFTTWCYVTDNRVELEGVKALSEMLKVNTTLKTLGIAGIILIASFFNTLLFHMFLFGIWLTESKIGDAGAIALCKALVGPKANTTLTTLNIACECSFMNTHFETTNTLILFCDVNTAGNIQKAGCEELGEMLQKNKTLIKLGLQSLSFAFWITRQTNNSLTLCLQCNAQTDNPLNAFCKGGLEKIVQGREGFVLEL